MKRKLPRFAIAIAALLTLAALAVSTRALRRSTSAEACPDGTRVDATAPDAPSTNDLARTGPRVTVELASGPIALQGFPAHFCQHQSATARGTAPYVLALAPGPKAEALTAVRACGARVVGPLAPNAFLVETSVFALGKLSADAHFVAAAEWLPARKVSPALKELLAATRQDVASAIEVRVVALAAADVEELVAAAEAAGGKRVEGCLNGKTSVALELPRAFVTKLPERAAVRWLEPFVRPKLLNDCAVKPVAMNVQPVWERHGLTGEGQVVSTSDSGIDTGDLATMHADLRNRVCGFRTAYSTCQSYDPNGHGTHTAGSIVGDGTLSDGQIRGVAYGAKLWAWFCLYDGGLYVPDRLDDLFRPDQDNFPAFIHSASWGSDVKGAYDAECSDVDEWVWNNPDFLPVFANGNAGSSARTGDSPASAKNVLAVGATQNARAATAQCYPNGNPQAVASFSSRGPCADGRIKPDLCAPGEGILSTRSSKGGTLYGVGPNTNYLYCSGTSMATPLAAGAATLVRQWLVECRGFTNATPTAALMKAVLTGGARNAAVPDNNFGWGRVDLGETLYPSNRAVRLVDRIPFAQGSLFTLDVTLTNAAPFDVQLVWIDYPADPAAGLALVNDLDLAVSNKTTGAVWFGNGTPAGDHTNNLESVRIATAEPGDYAVTVRGTDVLHSSYEGGAAALYLRGAFEAGPDPVPEPHRPVEIYVSASDGDDETGTGETNRPFATLQAALAKSLEGDVVKVGPGTYAGPVVPRGNWTRIESVEGPAVTLIDGAGSNRCFNASAYCEAVLVGFTLTNGYVRMTSANEVPGAGASGGILENCRIRDCHAEGNYGSGGGAHYAILTNCTVENCSAAWYGGGLYDCVATSCLIRNCEALGYTDSYGGGASKSTLTHCTVYGCCSLSESGVDCDCACTDSIVWGNERITGETSNWDPYRDWRGTYSPTFAYSCTTPAGHYDGGGNTHEEPRFVSAVTNDFRLLASSPCVGTASDGGNMGCWQGAGVPGFLLRTDTVGPGVVTPEQAAVLAGETATFVASEHHPFLRFETNGVFASAETTFVWTNVCADGTLTAYFANTNFYVDAETGDDASNGWSWASAKRTVTNAVDVAAEGETVWVNPGVYTGTVVCGSGPIVVRSTAGADVTTIVGEADGPCFYGYYYPSSVVDGFTLQNGHFGGGGGIYYGIASNCVIANCTAEQQGGGGYCATLVNCTVRGNRAGALRSRSSTLAGGGVDCNCVCTNTLIWGNVGPSGAEDNWEAYVERDRWGRTVTYVPFIYNCCTMPFNSQGTGNVFANPKLVTTNACDARVYEVSPCIGAGIGGANIGAYGGTGVVIPIPEVAPDAPGEIVSNAVAETGYADAGVADFIGTNATRYAEFRNWATNGLKTTAVVFSGRACDSFSVRELVAVPTLLTDGCASRFDLTAPTLESGGATCSVCVRLTDGNRTVPLGEAKEAFARHTRLGPTVDGIAPATAEDVRSAAAQSDGSVRLSLRPPAGESGFFGFGIP